MMSDVDLLTGKRVLVTGGSGFLGGKVLERLSSHDVAEVSAPRSADYDLRERDAIREAIGDARPESDRAPGGRRRRDRREHGDRPASSSTRTRSWASS